MDSSTRTRYLRAKTLATDTSTKSVFKSADIVMAKVFGSQALISYKKVAEHCCGGISQIEVAPPPTYHRSVIIFTEPDDNQNSVTVQFGDGAGDIYIIDINTQDIENTIPFSNGYSGEIIISPTANTIIISSPTPVSDLSISGERVKGINAFAGLDESSGEGISGTLDISACPILADVGIVNSPDLINVFLPATAPITLTRLILDGTGCTSFQIAGRGVTPPNTVDLHDFTMLHTVSIPRGPTTSLNISGCNILATLNVSNTNITSLIAPGFTTLTNVYCIDCPFLTVINLAGSGLISSNNEPFSTVGCLALENINISSCNGISESITFEASPSVKILDAHECANLITLGLNKTSIESVIAYGCPLLESITLLSLSANLTSLDIHNCPSLMYNIDLNSCPNLVNLDISYSGITGVNTDSCTSLATFNADGCTSLALIDSSNTGINQAGADALASVLINNPVPYGGVWDLTNQSIVSSPSLTQLHNAPFSWTIGGVF
jgi:hypothetical protein